MEGPVCWALGLMVLSLGAQELPPLPAPTSPPSIPEAGELLPLRPYVSPEASQAQALQYRGDPITYADGKLILQQGALETTELLLLADRIEYDPHTGVLEAEGSIRLEGVGVRLRCQRLRMDWHRRSGEAWALELEVPPEWTIRAEQVAFTDLRLWEFRQVVVTGCPQVEPAWSVRLSSLKVDLEGFARLRNAWLWVGKVPTPYLLPWAIYPARAQRSSGLLMVKGNPGGPLGWSLGAPWYQTLGDHADATVEPTYYRRQGILWGGELRWAPELTHAGSFTGQYIRQNLDGRSLYRYAFKELWQREDGWQLSIDHNRASDRFLLLDVDYGRGVGGLGAPVYDSTFFLGRSFRHLSFSLSGSDQRSFPLPSDPFYRPDFPASLSRRVLPELDVRMFPVRLPGGVYLEGGLRAGRFAYALDLGEGRPGNTYPWNREDAYVQVSAPLGRLGPLRLDAQGGLRFTHYGAALEAPLFDPVSGANGDWLQAALSPFKVDGRPLSRFLGTSRLQASLPQVGRTYEGLSLLGYRGDLKHILEPFVALTHNTHTGEGARIQRFDGVDGRPGVRGSVDGERSVEVGFKQHFFGRSGKGEAYQDLVRWRVSARYFFQPVLRSDGRLKQGWDTLDNEIDVEPSDRLRLTFRRSSEVGAQGTDNTLSADFKGEDGSRLNLALFSTGINSLVLRQQGLQMGGLRSFAGDRLRLEFQVGYDLKGGRFGFSQAALAWVQPCYSTSLRLSHHPLVVEGSLVGENRADLAFTLRNLGDIFGTGLKWK